MERRSPEIVACHYCSGQAALLSSGEETDMYRCAACGREFGISYLIDFTEVIKNLPASSPVPVAPRRRWWQFWKSAGGEQG